MSPGIRRAHPAVALLTAVLLAAAVACSRAREVGAIPQPPGAVLPANAVVERVVDGDTIGVRVGGGHPTVRLIGIDTPETVDPRRPEQCFGHEASQRTAALLPPGTPVHLVLDAETRDAYGRLLAYVYVAADGTFVNLDLAAGGYADVLRIEPNTAHSRELAAAVATARAAGAGLWGRCGGPDVALDPGPSG